MKSLPSIFLLTAICLMACNSGRQKAKCSAMIGMRPDLEIRKDTLFKVLKYDVKASLRAGCPVDYVEWIFLDEDVAPTAIVSSENEFVTIPHRVTYKQESIVRLKVVFSDGGIQSWNFPTIDIINQ